MSINGVASMLRRVVTPWFALLCTALVSVTHAADKHSVAGPATSDFSYVETMPPEWYKKPIEYQNVPEGTDVSVTLDQQLYPALLPLINEFAERHSLKIAVQEGTCGISSGALVDKKVDIGGYCCPAGETDRLPGLKFHTLGIGAIALIKNPRNPIQGVSLDTARKIYEGGVSRWNDLSTPDSVVPLNSPINMVARLHCKQRPGHWRLLLDNEDLFSPTVNEVGTIQGIINAVANNPSAIGYETLWMTRLYGKGRVETLAIDGVKPEDDLALAEGRYPLYRTFNITTWTDPTLVNPNAQALVDFLKKNFDRVDKKFGFVPANVLREHGWLFVGGELSSPPK